MPPEFLADTTRCTEDDTYQDVVDTYYAFMEIVNTALADDDSLRKMKLALLTHIVGIRRDLKDIEPQWLVNNYYPAGADFGRVLKFALKPWMQSESEQLFL